MRCCTSWSCHNPPSEGVFATSSTSLATRKHTRTQLLCALPSSPCSRTQCACCSPRSVGVDPASLRSNAAMSRHRTTSPGPLTPSSYAPSTLPGVNPSALNDRRRSSCSLTRLLCHRARGPDCSPRIADSLPSSHASHASHAASSPPASRYTWMHGATLVTRVAELDRELDHPDDEATAFKVAGGLLAAFRRAGIH